MERNPVVLADPNGVIRFWSPGAATSFGYSAAQAIGQTLDLIVPSEYRQAHWHGFRRAVEAGAAPLEGQLNPFPVRRAAGPRRPAQSVARRSPRHTRFFGRSPSQGRP